MRLRAFQSDAISALENRSQAHLLLVAPTGSGKSFVFQEYARRSRLRTLLLSPLTALSRQHADAFRARGVSASVLGEGAEEESQVWISSPERVFLPESGRWRRRLKDRGIGFLVVDECHTLREWGERFRPAFREIPGWFRETAPEKSAWLTATLPPADRDWMREFLPENARIEIGGFSFPTSLSFRAERVTAGRRLPRLFAWIRDNGTRGIVFTQTRSGAERTKKLLLAAGYSARAYHAGLSREERSAIERETHSPEPPLLVATTAFGMGMDLASLDWVLLLQPPLSVLQLAQQIGRAGRAGRPGNSLLLWDEVDFREPWSDAPSLIEVRDFLHAPGCHMRKLEAWFHS